MSDLNKARKGIFIPDITVEMFRNASLEAVEELLVSGEMQDIILPSAEPERKKGKWIPYSKVYECRYECSSCGYHLIGIHESEANFCPNCGAYMRGDKDEDR